MAIRKRDTVRGKAIAARRKVREYAMVAKALASTSHPVLAQIVPARFCNLSCAYCNEYDKVSEPVPLQEMYRRIDHLGRLGTAMIGISGGEPLTHPELDDIIRRMRKTGAIAGMITNGYLLNAERIERLGGRPNLRSGADGAPFRTDGGNLILDCAFGTIADPAALARDLAQVVGVIETGLFIGLCDTLIVARDQDVEVITTGADRCC